MKIMSAFKQAKTLLKTCCHKCKDKRQCEHPCCGEDFVEMEATHSALQLYGKEHAIQLYSRKRQRRGSASSRNRCKPPSQQHLVKCIRNSARCVICMIAKSDHGMMQPEYWKEWAKDAAIRSGHSSPEGPCNACVQLCSSSCFPAHVMLTRNALKNSNWFSRLLTAQPTLRALGSIRIATIDVAWALGSTNPATSCPCLPILTPSFPRALILTSMSASGSGIFPMAQSNGH